MLVTHIHHRHHHRWNDDWDNDDDYGYESYGREGYYRHRGLLGGVVGLLDDLL